MLFPFDRLRNSVQAKIIEWPGTCADQSGVLIDSLPLGALYICSLNSFSFLLSRLVDCGKFPGTKQRVANHCKLYIIETTPKYPPPSFLMENNYTHLFSTN